MPNNVTALIPEVWAQESLQNLFSNIVMAQLVHRDFESVAAQAGDTVNTRKPGTFSANDMGATTTVQDATASNVAVVLNKWKEVTFELSDKDLTLAMGDLVELFVSPAMEALAQQIDKDILGLYADVSASVGTAGTSATKDLVLDARKALNDAKAPMNNRRAVWSTKDERALLGVADFVSAEKVGDQGTTLREASLGRIFGIDHYMDQNVPVVAGTPNSTYNLLFHRNAFALVTRPLIAPQTAAVNSAVVSHKGIGLRSMVGYDISKKKHIVSIDVLYGVKTLDANLAVKILT
jgi:hypothetical protein